MERIEKVSLRNIQYVDSKNRVSPDIPYAFNTTQQESSYNF